jgi:hypothetical protein
MITIALLRSAKSTILLAANVGGDSDSVASVAGSICAFSTCQLEVTRTHENAYGVVYEIEGPIKTPSGRTVRFCSVWQVDTGTEVPRFITMYPR